MDKPKEKTAVQVRAEKLLTFLRSRQEDRGLMANLRCALVDSKRHRAWPFLARFGGIEDKYDKHLARTVQTIAGLYASHPEETSEGDFGTVCFKLLSDDEQKKLDAADGIGPISRRFQHLLVAEDEEIFDRVVRLALRAKTENIPINYERLFDDLMAWKKRADRVRTDWARSFWAPATEAGESP